MPTRKLRDSQAWGSGILRVVAVPFTTIVGERVLLRPFRVEDAVDIAESCQDPEIPRFTMMPEAMSEAQAQEWISRRQMTLEVALVGRSDQG